MRFRFLTVAILAVATVWITIPAGPAFAQPAGVTAINGVWATSEGNQLFLYTGGEKVPPLCDEKGCKGGGGWSPFPAWGNSSGGADWTIVNVSVHGRQWAFRGRPLYTRNGAWTPAIAEEEPDWREAAALIDPLDATDPRITAQPVRQPGQPPVYPSSALRSRDTGNTTAMFCVDREGRPQYVETSVSSGSQKLDQATHNWLWRSVRFSPAKVGNEAVAVCGVPFSLEWKLPG